MIIITNIVIALATAVYAIINYKQLKESQLIRKHKSTPLIVAFLKVSEDHCVLHLHIKNIGEGLAKNVKINVIKDYFIMDNETYPISNLSIVKNGISIFPPQYDFVNSIAWIEKLKGKEDKILCLNITYEGIDGRKYNEEYDLPYNQYIGHVYCNPSASYIGQIPHYLKEINSTIKNINSNKE